MLIRVAAAVIVVAVACTAKAFGAPGSGDPNVTELNRHLATLATQPAQSKAFESGAAPMLASPSNLSQRRANLLLLSPTILNLAARYSKAERLLHFQSHGFDANFWGALSSGRSIKLRYAIRF